ncbi:nucleotidyltransferase family protein [Candidatus Poriferisodalis sp.]|uniref:nucleotidyltransferase family protein n=1 Tax=Candidatus Poriferisodalis sp. TaxID=3101277 RepID=UPI003D12378C
MALHADRDRVERRHRSELLWLRAIVGNCAGTVENVNRRYAVLETHRAAIRIAAERAKARSISLIGSVARDEDTDRSDYDFLVEFDDDADLFDIAGLQVDSTELLGQHVDVVDSSAVRESHRGMFEDAILL